MTNPTRNCCYYNVRLSWSLWAKQQANKMNYSKTPVQTRLHKCNDKCNMS